MTGGGGWVKENISNVPIVRAEKCVCTYLLYANVILMISMCNVMFIGGNRLSAQLTALNSSAF